jgi:hypothetical protein
MSKSRSAKKNKKGPPVMVIVNSRAYGKHERAARGTWKKAKLNDAMKGHSKRMIGSNVPAKLILDALNPFRENFKGGLIWQKLIEHFARQVKEYKDYSVLGIENWDLNKEYPTSRIMAPNVKIETDPFSPILNITVSYTFGKRFLERKKSITSFRITIVVMFPDFIDNEIITIPVVMPDKLLEDVAPYSFIVQIPTGASSYLACFKAEACIHNVVTEDSGKIDKAMCLIKSGTC